MMMKMTTLLMMTMLLMMMMMMMIMMMMRRRRMIVMMMMIVRMMMRRRATADTFCPLLAGHTSVRQPWNDGDNSSDNEVVIMKYSSDIDEKGDNEVWRKNECRSSPALPHWSVRCKENTLTGGKRETQTNATAVQAPLRDSG